MKALLSEIELLGLLDRVGLVARRLGRGWASGFRDTSSTGAERIDHRDYAPGDDYRYVDWNVCARHDELRFRPSSGQTDRPTYLLVDTSRSMELGTPSKFAVARLAASAFAHVALARLDPVSVVAFSDRIVAHFGPIRGKTKILKLVRFLDRLDVRREGTDLAGAARQFVGRYPHRGTVLVVSDFLDPAGFQPGLDILRRNAYQVQMVQVCDPADAEPNLRGDAELVDLESGTTWQRTFTERQEAEFRRLFGEFQRALRCYAAGFRLPYARVPVDLPNEKLLLAALGVHRVDDS